MQTKAFIFYSPCSKTKVASFFGIFTLASLRLCVKTFFSGFGFISREGAKPQSFKSLT
jgi:hypothetical protein